MAERVEIPRSQGKITPTVRQEIIRFWQKILGADRSRLKPQLAEVKEILAAALREEPGVQEVVHSDRVEPPQVVKEIQVAQDIQIALPIGAVAVAVAPAQLELLRFLTKQVTVEAELPGWHPFRLP